MAQKDECDGVLSRQNGGHSVQLQKKKRSGENLATFRTLTGWKIDEKILQGLLSGMSVIADGRRNDLDDMD